MNNIYKYIKVDDATITKFWKFSSDALDKFNSTDSHRSFNTVSGVLGEILCSNEDNQSDRSLVDGAFETATNNSENILDSDNHKTQLQVLRQPK